ncbi:hypothetical protein D3C76_922610 [compost metagenome]
MSSMMVSTNMLTCGSSWRSRVKTSWLSTCGSVIEPICASMANSRLVPAEAAPPRNRIGRMLKRAMSRPPAAAPSSVMITPKILLTLAITSLEKPMSM